MNRIQLIFALASYMDHGAYQMVTTYTNEQLKILLEIYTTKV